MRAQHRYDHERDNWDAFARSTRDKVFEDTEPTFCWTQYTGHGPGPELLGDPSTALEIGYGTGRHLAYLAHRGVKMTGIDLSPVAVEQTREKWGPLGVQLHCAEVLDFLTKTSETYDAVYSIFGAVWFTDPSRLFPLVYEHLNPGGRFVFSQPPAIPGAYGPQGMYKGGFAGKETFLYRYAYTPEGWEGFLTEAGFKDACGRVHSAPEEGYIGTLIVQAQKD
ncbi:class I SAM-dependent methyltransferase [Streptomyces sp. WAC 06725]|uniref:class I SAM-dependent DNA methyltransferase n=1 Tax=Streptomyces sp. WAC 06725 TaxID=2203209 RepID=UPI00163C22E8